MFETPPRFVAVAALTLSATITALAQDPTKSLPDSYKVQFENDYVRVVRAHYDAGAKLAEHTHPAGTTVYVYLNDSQGIVFKHVGSNTNTVTRPPVKAGGMRIATGREEHHTAENTSSTATDFLRVFFKTEDPSGARNLRQRLSPGDKEWSNQQMRITRLTLEQHDTVAIAAKEPALLIGWPSGNDRWVDAGRSTTIENHDARDLNIVRIDFLTKPK